MKLLQSNSEDIIRLLLISLFYYFSIFIISYFFISCDFSDTSLLNWDSEHYQNISKTGYTQYLTDKGDERAFFPLFPYIWRLCNFSVLGACLFNSFIFVIGQSILFYLLKLDFRKALILMSTPSLVFMFLPYTESLFYISTVLIIYGIIKDRISIVLVGFFIASLTRPAYSILLPAYILTHFLINKPFKKSLIDSMLVVFSLILGVLIVSYIQYLDTNTWFGFIEAQGHQAWNNHLRFPSLPLRTWADFPAKPVDALAFITGLFSMTILLKKIFQNQSKKLEAYYFGLLYIFGICLAVLLFRGGDLYSLNRFVFATGFFPLFVSYVWKNIEIEKSVLITVMVSLGIIWFLFNGFNHIKFILVFLAMTAYCLSLIYINSKHIRIRNLSFCIAFVCSVCTQILFLKAFLNNEWVG